MGREDRDRGGHICQTPPLLSGTHQTMTCHSALCYRGSSPPAVNVLCRSALTYAATLRMGIVAYGRIYLSIYLLQPLLNYFFLIQPPTAKDMGTRLFTELYRLTSKGGLFLDSYINQATEPQGCISQHTIDRTAEV